MKAELAQLAYTQIAGMPLILLGGITTFILLLITASIPILNRMNITKVPITYHFFIGKITVFFALIHAALAIAVNS